MKRFILSFILLVFFILRPSQVFAEVIHSYDVNITAHKDGSMGFVETINYDFENEDRHGIYRYIPFYSRVGDLYRIIKIKNVKVLRDAQNENFTTNQTQEQIYFKIGDPDKTINGAHIYTIFYTVENGIGSNYKDHDEIYWNITGNDWQVAIEKASAKIETDFNIKLNNLICFEGQAKSDSQTCTVSENTISSSQGLFPGSGLTMVAGFPVDTFPKSVLVKEPPKSLGQKIAELIFANYYLIFIFFNFIIGGYLIYWYHKHKNKKRFGPPAVNFDIPKDGSGNRLAPALVGAIDTAKLERDDVVATIFDLAIRKYIKLEEIKSDKKVLGIFGKDSDQIITKLKDDDGKLASFEKTLFKRFFDKGDMVNISELKLDFYKTFQDMEEDVFKDLVNKKYYVKNPKNQKAILAMLAVLALVSGNMFLSVILFFLSVKLNGRTAFGDEVDFKIDGLKLFLKSMDRNYKWQAQNFYTVEQMIPYAMALGYIDKFMEALQVLKPDYNPSWYSGYHGSFFASYAAFSAVAASNITTSAPSSSSGFSGGSSGGGGGGGGGGSW